MPLIINNNGTQLKGDFTIKAIDLLDSAFVTKESDTTVINLSGVDSSRNDNNKDKEKTKLDNDNESQNKKTKDGNEENNDSNNQKQVEQLKEELKQLKEGQKKLKEEWEIELEQLKENIQKKELYMASYTKSWLNDYNTQQEWLESMKEQQKKLETQLGIAGARTAENNY